MRRRLWIPALIAAAAQACGTIIGTDPVDPPKTVDDSGAGSSSSSSSSGGDGSGEGAKEDAPAGGEQDAKPDVAFQDRDGSTKDAAKDALADAEKADSNDTTNKDADVDANPCAACVTGGCEPLTGECDALVFVTKAPHAGSFGLNANADNVDALCNAEAKLANLGALNFKAWVALDTGVTGGYYPWDQIKPSSRPYRLRDGTVVVGSFSVLKVWPPVLQQPITQSADGSLVIGAKAWTGLRSTGIHDSDCLQWTSGAASFLGMIGDMGTCNKGPCDAGWTSSVADKCDQPHHLYCFQSMP